MGRSRACDQCRRRRIRCDEGRPQCLRCVKSKLLCGGYRPFAVVQYNPAGKSVVSLTIAKCKKIDAEGQKTPIVSPLGYSANVSTSTVSLDFNTVLINYALQKKLGNGSSHDCSAPHIVIDRDLSDRCFMALATYSFGYEYKFKAIFEQGLRQYGQALRELNLRLSDAAKQTSFDTLDAVLVMTLLELQMSSDADGWIRHALGLERLFQLRGPSSFRPPVERAAFERSRLRIIFASMILRKRTLLADEEWKTTPWKYAPDSKTSAECLIDIMADCTHLLMMQDRLAAAIAGRKSLAWKLYGDLQSVAGQLKAWKTQWNITERDCSVEVHAANCSLASSTFPSSRSRLWYKTYHHASVTCMYDATVILVEGALKRLKASDLIASSSRDTHSDRIRIAALDICRSIDYCLQNASQRDGEFQMVYPIRMAWQALLPVEPSLAWWLEEKLSEVQQSVSGCWGVATYVLKLGNEAK